MKKLVSGQKKKYLLGLCLDYLSVFLEHGWYEKVYIKTTKKYLNKQITDLKEEKSKLDKEKSTLRESLATCEAQKTGLENSIHKDYVRKEELNRCLQDYTQKSDQNQKINDQNIKLSSQLQDKTACLQRQQHLQQQLDNIREELKSGFAKGLVLHGLTELERNERQIQQEQLVGQLKQINCQ
ncbi:TPA: hypothetical protein ACM24D_001539 [Neisseria meningitidis]